MSKRKKVKRANRGVQSDRRDAVKTGKKDHWSVKLGVGILTAVIAAAGIYFYIDHVPQQEAMAASPSQDAKPGTGMNVVSYPVTTFADGKARQFQHKLSDGTTIRYFVLRSSDGVIRAAFDACDVCWPQNKGYYQDGDYMVCKNCGKRFQSTKVNVITGGCNPSALERTIQEGKVVIQTKHIEEGKRFFPRG